MTIMTIINQRVAKGCGATVTGRTESTSPAAAQSVLSKASVASRPSAARFTVTFWPWIEASRKTREEVRVHRQGKLSE